MANNIISNYSNVLLDSVEYDEQINEALVVTKPSSNHPETMHNKNSSLENIENYIAAMSYLKQQFLKDVEIVIKNSINSNKVVFKKEDIMPRVTQNTWKWSKHNEWQNNWNTSFK